MTRIDKSRDGVIGPETKPAVTQLPSVGLPVSPPPKPKKKAKKKAKKK